MGARPNRAMRAGIKKALQRTFTHEGWAELLGSGLLLVGHKKFIRFFHASCWRLKQKKH
jgi:hypothetical protein